MRALGRIYGPGSSTGTGTTAESAQYAVASVKYTVIRNENLMKVAKQRESTGETDLETESYRSTVYCTKGTTCRGHHCGRRKRNSYDSTSFLRYIQ
jgi:hypothetical protein